MAVTGLLLAFVSGADQGYFDDVIRWLDGRTDRVGLTRWWNDWSGWIAFGLTVVLLATSAWFSADMRRMKRWSELATDLRNRSLDVVALHPDAVAGTLSSHHGEPGAKALRDELQGMVSGITTGFAEGKGLPSLEQMEKLEDAATRALSQSLEGEVDGDGGQPVERTPEGDAAWESVARLRAVAQQTRIELEENDGRGPGVAKARPAEGDADPGKRWSELLALATVLVGLIAAPSVADEITGDDENGEETTVVEDLEEELAQLRSDLAGISGQVEGLRQGGAVQGGAGGGGTSSEPQVTTVAGRDIVLFLPSDGEAPERRNVQEGDSIWELVETECPDDVSTRTTADRTIRTWQANVEVVGPDPNDIDIDQMLLIVCTPEVGDQADG